MSILCDWLGVGCSNPEANSQQSVVADLTRYVKVPKSGWLLVLNDNGEKFSICNFTKLRLINSSETRLHFKIMDGPHQGATASVKAEAVKYLDRTPPIRNTPTIIVQYKELKEVYSAVKQRSTLQQLAAINFNNKLASVTLNSFWNQGFTPIEPGTYNILIPDAPHDQAFTVDYRNHLPSLSYDQVWFPIEFGDNSRYIHVGHLSEGCIATLDLEKWHSLYEFLISHRAAEGKYVARLIVKK